MGPIGAPRAVGPLKKLRVLRAVCCPGLTDGRTDGRTVGRTDGWTDPLIEMRGRI